ncbi:hypothetical protein DFP72DRAFT_134878 [Ephemerocybe angulata]|uniref:Uncharacterized protein n=1 Tax=Ephemerocybe angulata TaxID=980116 RepID=A0A8H6I7Q0_9AGAR|nr:hypothetical protein DFP72DRAFT_134878 [Tulosesus angulatus]
MSKAYLCLDVPVQLSYSFPAFSFVFLAVYLDFGFTVRGMGTRGNMIRIRQVRATARIFPPSRNSGRRHRVVIPTTDRPQSSRIRRDGELCRFMKGCRPSGEILRRWNGVLGWIWGGCGEIGLDEVWGNVGRLSPRQWDPSFSVPYVAGNVVLTSFLPLRALGAVDERCVL